MDTDSRIIYQFMKKNNFAESWSPPVIFRDEKSLTNHKKISRNDFENISAELREQNRLFESTEPPNSLFSASSRVGEVLGFECPYCDQSFSADIERVKHIDLTHLGKLYYPTREEFENRLKPNRKRWAKNLSL
jgi:uncharacterized C2H2 Zn-finger protein